MSKESICVRVTKIHGEKAIILASELKIVDRELEIQRDKDFVYIPFVRYPSETELKAFKKQVPDCEFLTYAFSERKKKQTKTFVKLLKDELPRRLSAKLPRSIDFVGDIAIVEVPTELDAHKSIIGEAVLKAHKNVRTVLAKAGAVSGIYRLRGFKVIAGESKTETVHKEYGCKYFLDLTKAYFSPRLSYEHNRVASLVKEGETVVDLFAGVGPFSILIAKTRENVKVYAVDVNPNAVEFLKKNVRLNRVERKVCPIMGDAKRIVKQRLSGVANRVVMNLPEKALEFVDVACEAIKPSGGIVHFYSFVNASVSLENITRQFIDTVKASGRKVERILFSRFVRATAPYEWQAVVDVKIR
jgi:tRNA (guanine37-N1)-methyltransferase